MDADVLPRTLAVEDALLESLPIGVYVCAADGTITRFNRQAGELWGREPKLGDSDERFCGASRLFWPDGRPLPHDQTPMAAALATGQTSKNLEVCVERPSGERIIVLVNISPLRDAQGRIVGAVNCFHDVTERKRTEEALRESRAFQQAVIDTTPECVKVVARDGMLLQMNAAGLGMVEAEGSGRIEGGSIYAVIAPEHRDAWRKHHEQVCNGETLSWEFDIVGLKGTRRSMQTHAAPLLFRGETVQLAITRDVTEQARQRRRLEESEQRARDLLQALPAAVYTTDAAGRITFYNETAVALWGQRPTLGSSQWCGAWRLLTADGEPLPHDRCPMAVALREARPVRDVAAMLERPDGTRIPFMPYPTPLYDHDGTLIGAVNMLVDISLHKRAEERQAALINELNHRVKNSLATVQSMAQQTLRHSGNAEAFREGFTRRLLALSRAHDLLTSGGWEGASLADLLQAVLLSPYSSGAEQIRADGPHVRLSPRSALALSMALHELATNAAKHGALSVQAGCLSVSWTLDTKRLQFDWTEFGGPAVVSPTRTGLGTRMLEKTLLGELGGELSRDWNTRGLHLRFAVPTSSLA